MRGEEEEVEVEEEVVTVLAAAKEVGMPGMGDVWSLSKVISSKSSGSDLKGYTSCRAESAGILC